MRHLIGVLYLVTALLGLRWSVYLTMTSLYGAPFSYWYLAVFIGGMTLLLGAIFWWMSPREWARWLPILGSFLLSMYFVPGFISLARQGRVDVISLVVLALVIASLVVAVKFRTFQPGPVGG